MAKAKKTIRAKIKKNFNKKVKLKSNRAAKKRFKETGSGEIMAVKANKSHLLFKKSKSRKRRLAGWEKLEGKNKLRALRLLGIKA